MNVGSLLTIIVAALAILGAAGSAWAFLADRGNKTRLEGLRSDIADRNERIDFLVDENARLTTELTAVKLVNVGFTSEIASLTRYVDGSAGTLRTINDLIQSHHEAAVNGIATLETQNADILRILGDRRQVPPENLTKAVNDEPS